MLIERESGVLQDTPSASPIDPALRDKADEILRLLASGKKCVTVSGPAGCGKTELIKDIRNRRGDDNSAHVMTFTNQAALMLRQKGARGRNDDTQHDPPPQGRRFQ